MNRPSRIFKWCLLSGVGFCGVAVATLFLYHRYHYPHGFRSGKLPVFIQYLKAYAEDHGGWYPKRARDPLECLSQLYPKYASESLAGLSGSERRTLKLLEQKKPLDGTASSWIYWPGFRLDDDPKIAIIWEREDGLFITGGRADGHAVGFADGGYDQIPADEWADFVKEQESLRKKVLASRSDKLKEP